MDFDKVVQKRRSVRKFKAKRVSWKNVLEAISAAIHGPFANNKNNLMFLIIENPETIQKIAALSEQDWIADASIVVAVCSNALPLEQLFDERGKGYARQQAGAAIQTMLFKLVDIGLAACWVGSFEDEKVKNLLEIPANIQIEALIPIGYEPAKTLAPRKRDLDTCIYWEAWDKRKRPTIFQEPSIHNNP